MDTDQRLQQHLHGLTDRQAQREDLLEESATQNTRAGAVLEFMQFQWGPE